MSDGMSEEDWRALGLRAVACKGWRWLNGCVYSGPGGEWGSVVQDAGAGETEVCCFGDLPGIYHDSDMVGRWPDFQAPASLGCLESLVREAWGAEFVWVEPQHSQAEPDGRWCWIVYATKSDWPIPLRQSTPTVEIARAFGRAQALVLALEAAP